MAKIPDIKPGDLVKVYAKIKEGNKERITPFQGIIIQIRGSNLSKTFTVRKISAGIGVERIFQFHSPMIQKIEIKKKGKVRRAKLNYLRQRKGRKLKIKELSQKPEKIKEQVSEKSEEQEKTKPEIPKTEKSEKQEKTKPEEKKQEIPEEQKIKKPKENKGEGAPRQKTVEKT